MEPLGEVTTSSRSGALLFLLVFVGLCRFSIGFCRFSIGFSWFSESVFLSVVSLDSVLTVGYLQGPYKDLTRTLQGPCKDLVWTL